MPDADPANEPRAGVPPCAADEKRAFGCELGRSAWVLVCLGGPEDDPTYVSLTLQLPDEAFAVSSRTDPSAFHYFSLRSPHATRAALRVRRQDRDVFVHSTTWEPDRADGVVIRPGADDQTDTEYPCLAAPEGSGIHFLPVEGLIAVTPQAHPL